MSKSVQAYTIARENSVEVSIKDLVFRPSIYGIIVQGDSVLLNRHVSGKYEVPGGGIDLGEDLEEALHREIMEETGLEVDIQSSQPLFVESSFFKPSKSESYHTILMFYLCKNPRGKITRENYIDDYERENLTLASWVNIEDAKKIEYMLPVDMTQVIENAQKIIGGNLEVK